MFAVTCIASCLFGNSCHVAAACLLISGYPFTMLLVTLAILWHFNYHPRSGVVYNCGLSVVSRCLSVCLSVCLSHDNFHNYWRRLYRKFILAHKVYLQRIRVRFVYEGHRVKVKVTIQKQTKLKALFPQQTSLVSNSPSVRRRVMNFACILQVFEWCVRHLCHVTGSERAQMHTFAGGRP